MTQPRTLQEMQDRYKASRFRMETGGQTMSDPPRSAFEQQLTIARQERAIEQLTETVADLVDRIVDLEEKCAAGFGYGEATSDDEEQIRVPAVIEAVTREFKVARADLISDRRDHATLKARLSAMWLAKRFTRASMPVIGQAIGNRDHTTIVSGFRRVEAIIATQPFRPQEDTFAAWLRFLAGIKWPRNVRS